MMLKTIDLSGDVGEGAGNDAALIPLLTSASIACGGHAGDERSILEAIATALDAGVQVGAHPGFADRENFGRRAMIVSAADVYESVTMQLADFARLATGAGAGVKHVKPHGALYHQAATDAEIAAAVVRACLSLGRPAVVGPAQSILERAAIQAGLPFVREAFADRAYDAQGLLVPRTDPRAMITDIDRAIAQSLQIVCEQSITTIDGSVLSMEAQTICLHSDGSHAVQFATQIRNSLQKAGISVAANSFDR